MVGIKKGEYLDLPGINREKKQFSALSPLLMYDISKNWDFFYQKLLSCVDDIIHQYITSVMGTIYIIVVLTLHLPYGFCGLVSILIATKYHCSALVLYQLSVLENTFLVLSYERMKHWNIWCITFAPLMPNFKEMHHLQFSLLAWILQQPQQFQIWGGKHTLIYIISFPAIHSPTSCPSPHQQSYLLSLLTIG